MKIGRAIRSVPQFVWLAFALSRLWIALFVYLGHFSHPFQEKIPGAFAGVSNFWLNPWTTYDSEHFLHIAAHGYTAKLTAFFPLYPFLLRPFGPDENSMALAGVLISNLAFALSLGVFYHLTRRDLGESVASVSVWVLAFFPAGAFSMSIYTESVFLLLALLAFWFARKKQWIVAGLFATGAALTRNSGPILFAALLLEWVIQQRQTASSTIRPPKTRFFLLRPDFWAIFLPLVAFVVVQQSFKATFGDAASTLNVQKDFGRAFSLPFVPIYRDFLLLLSPSSANLVIFLNWLCSILVWVFAWVYRKKLRAAEIVFMCGVMLAQLCFSRIWAPFTISSLRYVFSTWPFAQSLALGALNSPSKRTKQALFAIELLACALVSFLFGAKNFVS